MRLQGAGEPIHAFPLQPKTDLGASSSSRKNHNVCYSTRLGTGWMASSSARIYPRASVMSVFGNSFAEKWQSNTLGLDFRVASVLLTRSARGPHTPSHDQQTLMTSLNPGVKTHTPTSSGALQSSAKRRSPGLVNFVTALAYLFCLDLPAAFTQPGSCILGEPCT